MKFSEFQLKGTYLGCQVEKALDASYLIEEEKEKSTKKKPS